MSRMDGKKTHTHTYYESSVILERSPSEKTPATLTRTVLAYGRNLLCFFTQTNSGTGLTLKPDEMMSVQSSRTERLFSVGVFFSLQSCCPLVDRGHNLLKGMFGVEEAGTVVANPLYYQEEDNGV